MWKPGSEVSRGACRQCLNEEERARYAQDTKFRAERIARSIKRKRGVEVVPPDAVEMLLEMFDNACAYCPAPATTWDHVVPVKRGGLTEPANIVPACRTCNSSKNDSDVWTWLERTGRAPQDAFYDRLMLADCSLTLPRGPTAIDEAA